MDSLKQARDSGIIIDSNFFDFTKAFNRVPYQPLIHKLQEYRITGNTLKWVESLLTSRAFQVRVGFTTSISSVICSGVPHGSVLGPPFFVIYINDLPQNIVSQSLLYADDLSVWNTEPNQSKMDVERQQLRSNKLQYISRDPVSQPRFRSQIPQIIRRTTGLQENFYCLEKTTCITNRSYLYS